MTPRQGSRLAWAAAATPFVLLGFFLYRYAVDVPFFDQWLFLWTYDSFLENGLSMSLLWEQHNEHRPVVIRLYLIGLARLSDWNIRLEIASSFVVAAVSFFVLARQALRSAREAGFRPEWPIALLAWILCSMGQWENWIWGWQIQIFVAVLSAAAGLLLLAVGPATPRRFAGAALLGVVGTFSFSSGFAFWVVGAFVLLMRSSDGWKRVYPAAWLGVIAIVITVYLQGYSGPEWHEPIWAFATTPLRFVLYVLAYLGGPVAFFQAGLAPLFGLLGLGLQVALFLRATAILREAMLPWVTLAVYAVVSGVITGIGRTSMGIDQALSARYVTVAQLLWVSIVFSLILAVFAPRLRDSGQRGIRLARVAIGAIAVAVTITCAVGVRQAYERHRFLVQCRELLLQYPSVSAEQMQYLSTITPSPDWIHEAIDVLRRHRITVYRNQDPQPATDSAP